MRSEFTNIPIPYLISILTTIITITTLITNMDHTVSEERHRFTKRSSSSLSSSSSNSSSPSWNSEPSLDDETYLMHKPQYSLSCSNISEVQRKINNRESEDFVFDHSDQRHRHSLENTDKLLPGSQHGHGMAKLSRGHSKSEEGLLQNKHNDCYSAESQHMDHGPLYKTASLGQSLAFSGNVDIALGGRAVPKKAVSTIQLPSKGILKNKDEGQKGGNFRKAKSMEVLSTRVHVTETTKQISTEAASNTFVKGKMQFSAFLDEITRQVISPCALSSFGVAAPTPPKSPNEERINRSGKQESVVSSPKQQPTRAERPDSGKTGTDSSSLSRSHKRPSKQHQDQYHNRSLTSPPSPPPRHPSKAERQGATSGKQHQRQYTQMLTDGTSTSPESIHRHLSKHKVRHQSSHSPFRPLVKQEKGSPPPLQAPGLESESQSSKSSTSASSEKSDRPKHTGHRRQSKPHRDSVGSVERVQMLEEYNKELHENLLQTVACIENMEAELHCTKTELGSFKEKYRRLQESYSVSQQANSVLEQKLKSAVDSLDSERKFLKQRVVDLTKQLDTAQKTINSLETINVHSLISELLKNHFDSQERLEHFLCPQTSSGHPDNDQSDRNNQPSGGKREVFEWPQTEETCSGVRQQPATAFLPWKHDHDPWAGTEQSVVKGSDSQLLFPFTDHVPIHKTMADTKAPSHQMHHLAMNTEIRIVPPNPYNLDEMRLSRQTGGEGTVMVGKDSTDFSHFTAQRMLNEFLNQIPPPVHDGEGKDSLEAVMGARELTEGKE
ncbi:Tight junction-associated protein 1 [Anabarilius grahami]|uniref:Tight junction-associated protein 1 n=1 Tax=Anabarilius grahami TaxID=495550 RepID=A0A3N0YLT8_ANAGA|nr:Tight junction-associated protein 1 [Anabarilius grahami]